VCFHQSGTRRAAIHWSATLLSHVREASIVGRIAPLASEDLLLLRLVDGPDRWLEAETARERAVQVSHPRV